MKYEINIEGGFTGISKRFEGEVKLNKNEEQEMLDAVSVKQEDHSHLRDGFTYTVKLTDEEGVYESQFNESNLPKKIRHFITDIQKGGN
ncbi:protealysin inhibitor emfourin [Zobellia alginiliquefaciens]|uniref:protealysin inhibitor emfourin n=1 Tax=Zobellia alginiliquefaciens TaxID=3032586 RepID=UPI0023E410E8|nr:protealysin inhibitor emfourin [Zobellia alginiliquefaciens]